MLVDHAVDASSSSQDADQSEPLWFGHKHILKPGKKISWSLKSGCLAMFSPGQDWSISTTATMVANKFSTDITGPQRMNPDDFGRLVFPVVPSLGQSFQYFWCLYVWILGNWLSNKPQL